MGLEVTVVIASNRLCKLEGDIRHAVEYLKCLVHH